MARTNKPVAGGSGLGSGQTQQQPTNPLAATVRPQGVAPAQFATVGGYVLPQQLAQQVAAAGRPQLITMPGQPGQQFMLNPNMQALYAQHLQAAIQAQQAAQQQQQQQQQQQLQQAARSQHPGVQQSASVASTMGVRGASPTPQQPQQQTQQAPAVQQPAVGLVQSVRPNVPLAPPVNFTINLKMPTGEVRPYSIPQEFLRAHPNEWPAWVTNPALHMDMWQKFSAWHTNKGASINRPPSAPPAAKRPKQEPVHVPTGPRPHQLPTHLQAGGVGAHGAMRASSPNIQQQQPPPTAAAAGAAAQAAIQQRLAAAGLGGGGQATRLGFPSITKPTNEEDKLFLPKPRLQSLVRDACGPGAKLTSDAEQALKSMAQEFVANAVAFGVSMAKRRKGEVLEQADLQLYFERTWNLQIPGFNDAEVRPYRRPAASDIHRARMVAVRRSVADASTAKAAGQPDATDTTAGGPGSSTPAALDSQAAREGEAGAPGAVRDPATGAGAAVAVPSGKAFQATQPTNGKDGSGTAAADGDGRASVGKLQQTAATAAAENEGGDDEEDMPDIGNGDANGFA